MFCDGDVVEDHLYNLSLFEDASGRWGMSVNSIFQFLPGLEEYVNSKRGNSNELCIVVGGELNLSNECLG